MPCRMLVSMVCLAASANGATAQDPQRPNIVYLFADDMGWGTGQFNNPDSPIETPHLNALAANGINFTRHYSATVCSPSRAMLMTGFHTGHTSNDRNANIGRGLRREEVTVAEVLSGAGYQTALFGKWGWGGSGGDGVLRPTPRINNPATLPHQRGFKEFYGYLSHGRAHSYQVDSLWTNVEPADDNGDGQDQVGEKYRPQPNEHLWLEKTGNNPGNPLANYTHDLVGVKSEAYVRDHAGQAEPFYLQVNYTIPHFDLDAIASTAPLLDLDGKVLFAGGLGQYASVTTMTEKERKHAAMVSRMDASIGSLIRRLADPNGDGDSDDSVLESTLILFSSDNGPTPEDGLGAASITKLDLAGGLRGGKRDLYEGGIRSPLIVRWDGAIDARRRGAADASLTDLTDFVATAAELGGATAPVGIDGVSIAPRLSGVGERRAGKVILSENFARSNTGNADADWTLIRGSQKLIRFRDGAFGLYDLDADPGESSPLDLTAPANAALKQELEAVALAEGAGRQDGYFVRYADWAGGAANASFGEAARWSVGTGPKANWSASIGNRTDAARSIAVRQPRALLGLEVAGQQAETTLTVMPGQVLSARNEVRIGAGGRIDIAGAELVTTRWVNVERGGRLVGQGVVRGDVYNGGRLAPGPAAGAEAPGSGALTDETPALVVDGNLKHLRGGMIDLRLDGAASQAQERGMRGLVTVLGTASLAGDIRLSVVEDYTPTRGDRFVLLSASQVDGEFESVVAAPAEPTLGLRVLYERGRVLAVVAPALDGDYNTDGRVDTKDYAVWRDTRGQEVSVFTQGDGDGNGRVDAADLDLWSAQVGSSLSEPNKASGPATRGGRSTEPPQRGTSGRR